MRRLWVWLFGPEGISAPQLLTYGFIFLVGVVAPVVAVFGFVYLLARALLH